MIHSMPQIVTHAKARAETEGFRASCDDIAGRLLSVLAATVREGGAIIELGTGAGVSLAWILSGLGGRTDVEVVSVDRDARALRLAASMALPPFVSLRQGDAAEVLEACRRRFSLIFADAPSGKFSHLENTIAALEPEGILMLDDMRPAQYVFRDHAEALERIRWTIRGREDLVSIEIPAGGALVLAVRRRTPEHANGGLRHVG